jgi:hypothetical protein
MVDQPERESADERESRLLLIRFLVISDGTLDRFLDELLHAMSRQKMRTIDIHMLNLQTIWRSARASLRGVIQSISVGLSRTRREALAQVGMFGEALRANFDLLSLDIREGAIKRVLKRLNSMFSSLTKVFPALHVVKELKDHAEATMDSLKEPLDIISLEDFLKEQ